MTHCTEGHSALVTPTASVVLATQPRFTRTSKHLTRRANVIGCLPRKTTGRSHESSISVGATTQYLTSSPHNTRYEGTNSCYSLMTHPRKFSSLHKISGEARYFSFPSQNLEVPCNTTHFTIICHTKLRHLFELSILFSKPCASSKRGHPAAFSPSSQ